MGYVSNILITGEQWLHVDLLEQACGERIKCKHWFSQRIQFKEI